ncbi:MAG TPA: hypothetical protein VHJ20_21670 [Polyangia bacterium]|nr:hypothetical protein [Polyangia bacterium]
MPEPTPRPRARRLAARVALGVALFGLAIVAAAPLVIRGRRFGALVERALPPMRGHVRVGGGRWSWGGLLAFARHQPTPLSLEDVTITDATGEEVLHVDRLTGTLRREPSRIVVNGLELDGVRWHFVDAGDGGGIRFLSAFRARAAAATGPARAKTGTAFGFAIEDARLSHLDATLSFPAWELSLTDADVVRASLELDGGFTFSVADADVRGGGHLRVGGAALSFSQAHLARVATTSAAPDTIRIEARDVAAGASTLAMQADFNGVYGVSRPRVRPGLTLAVTASHAADALAAAAAGRLPRGLTLGGSDATTFAFELAGPYDDLRATLKLRALALRDGPLALDPIDLDAEAAPRAGRYQLSNVSIGWPGVGRLEGGVAVDVTGDGATLREVSLAFVRPPAASGPRVIDLGSQNATDARRPGADVGVSVGALAFAHGAITARHLTLPLLGGTVDASGRLVVRNEVHGRWLASPVVDATVDARRLRLDRVLGKRFVSGDVSFRARVVGRTSDLHVTLAVPSRERLTILGEPFHLPRAVDFVFTEGAARLHLALKGDARARVVADGRVSTAGDATLDVDIDRFPLGHLPGVADTGLGLEGPISGRLRLAGALEDLALEGRLEVDPVTFRGRDAGHASLAIASETSGALHAKGALMRGVDFDGTLRATPAGPSGEATLRLNRFDTDALGVALPGGVGLRAIASGALTARIAPGRASAVEGRLSALSLSITPPARLGGRPIDLEATGAIELAARADTGLSFGPARLRGALGDLVVGASAKLAGAHASVRGRLALAPLAPLLAPWMTSSSGALDVDLRATRASMRAPIRVEGDVVIAAPVSLTLVTAPVSLRASAGALRFTDGAIEARGLTTTFDANLGARALVSRAKGALTLDGRVDDPASTVKARLAVPHAEIEVPRVGPAPLVVDAARASLSGPLPRALDDVGRLAFTDVDVPVRGSAKGLATPAGTLDRATFALRLAGGGPAHPLTLAGDVDVQGAHVRPSQLSAASGGGAPGAATKPRPEILDPRLDVHVRSRGGAVEVELAHAPDVHVDLDLHASGTLSHPKVTGGAKAKGLYSKILLGLKNLFQ